MLLGGSFNPLATRNYIRLVYSPERLALEHMHSGNTTTSLVLNSILKNKKVSVTPQKLEALLKVIGVEFYLPITKNSKNLFDSLVGKSKYSGFGGVYVFTHIASGSMYVGSSNLVLGVWNIILKTTLNMLVVNLYLLLTNKVLVLLS